MRLALAFSTAKVSNKVCAVTQRVGPTQLVPHFEYRSTRYWCSRRESNPEPWD